MKFTRRDFLRLGAAGGAAMFVASRTRFMHNVLAAQSPQTPLAGSAIPQFIDPVPNLLDADHFIQDNGSLIQLEMREQLANILPANTVPGYAGTYVWSYLKPGQASRLSYLGPVVLTTRNLPTQMKFTNLLGSTTGNHVLAWNNSTDQTLHWADPLNNGANMWNHMAAPPAYLSEGSLNYAGSIPAAVHLHGGEVPPVLDGGPESWFLSDGSHVGSGYYSGDGIGLKNYCLYRYPNSMEGALIWFHDHTLGATRLNVYAGLAGAYLIADPLNNIQLGQLPPLTPLVIQDRMFDTTGQLFFPSDSLGGVLWALNPEHPYWVPEFMGDTIVINGKSWPFMNVQAKRYTFMFINGSNARTYGMSLIDPISKNLGPALWVIGTDGGFLDVPAKIDPAAVGNNTLVIMPGERYWVIVDFAKFQAGMVGPNGAAYSGTWVLKNNAKTPYPAGAAPQGSTLGRLMQFRVATGALTDPSYDPASGAPLRTPMIRLTGSTVQKTRQLTLNEVALPPITAVDPVSGLTTVYPGGPEEILVNNTKWMGKRPNGVDQNGMLTMEVRTDFTLDGLGVNYLSELPNEGDTELWEIVNTTADAHPIHLHLVQFQLLNRQGYNTNKYTKAYAAAFPGGGWDARLGAAYLPGVYIPAFGPPLNYQTGNARALGGNPDIVPFLQGPVMPPLPQENGWKDTVIMLPGQVTRILVRWAPTTLPANTAPANAFFPFDPAALGFEYVWHCHIVDHEDNEMMRPNEIVPNPNASRTIIQGLDY